MEIRQSLALTSSITVSVKPSAQSYVHAILFRWMKEYVPALSRCSTWQPLAEQHLKTDEFVWVVEESNSRGDYPTVRITELRYCPIASHSPAYCARTADRSSVRA